MIYRCAQAVDSAQRAAARGSQFEMTGPEQDQGATDGRYASGSAAGASRRSVLRSAAALGMAALAGLVTRTRALAAVARPRAEGLATEEVAIDYHAWTTSADWSGGAANGTR